MSDLPRVCIRARWVSRAGTAAQRGAARRDVAQCVLVGYVLLTIIESECPASTATV